MGTDPASVTVLPSLSCPLIAGFQPLLLEPLFKFHHTLRMLDLQEEEYVLMQALSLFSPGNQIMPVLANQLLTKPANVSTLECTQCTHFLRLKWL